MTKKILIFILILGSLWRLVGLTKTPPALNWDEVSIGYNAYSILHTAKDEWGKFLPLSFKAFGEHKLPGMIYLSVPSIAVFGLNEFGVRFTSAFFGILTIGAIFLLAKQLLQSTKQALISAFLLAISPWHIHFSRVAFEATPALFFFLVATYFLTLAKRLTSRKYYLLSAIFYIFSLYTYNSLRIFLPLFFLSLLLTKVVIINQRNFKTILPAILLGLICVVPIVNELTSSQGRVRFNALNISSQKSFLTDISVSRGYTALPSVLPKLIHNKVTHYLFKFSYNYLQTFSTEFLYFQGEANTQRSIQGMGLFYLFELPLFIMGLFSLVKLSSSSRKIILAILLLSPIPSAITIDAPSSVRTLTLLPAILMVESLGVTTILKFLKGKSKLITLSILVFSVWNIAYFAYQLFLVYPVKYADDWQYGYKQAMKYAYDNYNQVERIYFTSKYGEPYIYALFYGKFDPAKYQQLDVKYSIDPLGWVHVDSFDKFIFTQFTGLQTPDEIIQRTQGKSLLITSFAQLPNSIPRTFELKAPNWKVMFEGAVVDGLE